MAFNRLRSCAFHEKNDCSSQSMQEETILLLIGRNEDIDELRWKVRASAIKAGWASTYARASVDQIEIVKLDSGTV